MRNDWLWTYPVHITMGIMLLAVIIGGSLGWMRIAHKVRQESTGKGAITSPRISLSRTMHPLASALGFMSYGLHAGHAIFTMIAIDAVLRGNAMLATAAGTLAGLGIFTSHYAKTIVLPTHDQLSIRRATLCANLFLVTHAIIGLILSAIWLGGLDTVSVDVQYFGIWGKFEAHSEKMSLRAFLDEESWFLGPRLGCYRNIEWRTLGCIFFSYGCAAIVEAVLVHSVARKYPKTSL